MISRNGLAIEENVGFNDLKIGVYEKYSIILQCLLFFNRIYLPIKCLERFCHQDASCELLKLIKWQLELAFHNLIMRSMIYPKSILILIVPLKYGENIFFSITIFFRSVDWIWVSCTHSAVVRHRFKANYDRFKRIFLNFLTSKTTIGLEGEIWIQPTLIFKLGPKRSNYCNLSNLKKTC